MLQQRSNNSAPDIFLLDSYYSTSPNNENYTLILHTVYQIWSESSRCLSPVLPTPILRIVRPLSQLATRLQQDLLDFFKPVLNSHLSKLQLWLRLHTVFASIIVSMPRTKNGCSLAKRIRTAQTNQRLKVKYLWRMFKFELSDGTVTLTAIDYKQLSEMVGQMTSKHLIWYTQFDLLSWTCIELIRHVGFYLQYANLCPDTEDQVDKTRNLDKKANGM